MGGGGGLAIYLAAAFVFIFIAFLWGRTMIYVNGRRFHTSERFISYWEVVRLAGLDPREVWTVTYHSQHSTGSLSRDGAAEVENGMIFTVAA